MSLSTTVLSAQPTTFLTQITKLAVAQAANEQSATPSSTAPTIPSATTVPKKKGMSKGVKTLLIVLGVGLSLILSPLMFLILWQLSEDIGKKWKEHKEDNEARGGSDQVVVIR
jgi:uncharacterized protein HemX